jgi:hypothetical protein
MSALKGNISQSQAINNLKYFWSIENLGNWCTEKRNFYRVPAKTKYANFNVNLFYITVHTVQDGS